jgi:glycosyltransferase involved in cell wall biosynthesis
VLSGFLDETDRARYRPHLVVLSKPGGPVVPDLAKDPGAVPQRLLHWGGMRSFATIRELADIVRRDRIRIVHSHDSRSTLAAWLLMRREPVTWVAHMHGWLGRTSVAKNQIVEAIAKRLQRRADLVIGGSRHTCSEVEHLGMRRLHVLSNGIRIPDMTRLGPDRRRLREQFGVADSTILVGVVSRLHPGKGHRHLFEAISRLRNRGMDVAVLVVGDGDHRAALEDQVRSLALSPIIRFAGRVESVAPYLAAMDVYCLPSLKESLSIAVLEAMAAGLPVVTTRVGDFSSLIDPGRNGYLAVPGDAGALEEPLGKLVVDRALRERIGRAGLQTVRERFSLQSMVRRLESFYDEALTAATPTQRSDSSEGLDA